MKLRREDNVSKQTILIKRLVKKKEKKNIMGLQRAICFGLYSARYVYCSVVIIFHPFHKFFINPLPKLHDAVCVTTLRPVVTAGKFMSTCV